MGAGQVRKMVANHEGGHALVSQLLPLNNRVHRVSIIPISKGALGYTMELPEEDRHLTSKPALEQRLAVMLGGRAAENFVFQQTSTGAANDIERATPLELIRTHEAALNEIARVLQEDEVIDGETVARIVAEEPVEEGAPL